MLGTDVKSESLSLSHPLTLFLSLSLPHSFSLTLSLSLCHSFSDSLSPTPFFLSLSLSSLSLSLTLSLSLSLSFSVVYLNIVHVRLFVFSLSSYVNSRTSILTVGEGKERLFVIFISKDDDMYIVGEWYVYSKRVGERKREGERERERGGRDREGVEKGRQSEWRKKRVKTR